MKRCLYFKQFILLFFFFPLIVTAQKTQKEDPPPIKLPSFTEQIVVVGEIVAETATVTIITSDQIKSFGVRTVAEALKHIPGAHVRTGGQGAAYIRLRGFRQRETALLIDGIPVSSPYDGQFDLSTLPADIVDRIEVVKGASSVMYGASAMGGVINIITKKSVGSNHFNLSGEYGSGNSGSVGASFQGKIKNTRFFLSGSYFDSQSYPLSRDYKEQPFQSSGNRANSDRRLWNIKAGLGWDVGNQGRVALNFHQIGQNRGLPHHESDDKSKYSRYSDWNQGLLDVVYDKEWNKSSLKSKLYFNYLDTILESYDDSNYNSQENKNSYQETMENDSFGGDVFYRNSLAPSFLLKSAVRYRYDFNRSKQDLGEDWVSQGINTRVLPAEVEWELGKNFDVSAGTSLDLLFFSGGQGEKENTTVSFNPQVSLLYKTSDVLKFRFSASRKSRFPTMKEFFLPISGNPDLLPMKSDIYELGFIFSKSPEFQFTLTGFYNDVKNLISRKNKNSPFENIARALFTGLEAAVNVAQSRNLDLNLAYTYLYTEDKSSNLQESIEYRPRHKLDASVMLNLPAQFVLNANGGIVSSQFFYEGGEKRKLDPHTLVDIKLSKKLMEMSEIYITIRNLFDVNYYESDGYPREGRMILGGIQIAF
ncbi:MAG: TonB-dependent receptor [Candidatus Aminicenantes bacterium]|nr:TonB-dependent receptor [Candidatus Aminicenantes bacterium]